MELSQFLFAALGAFAAGVVNALAGGGTLITFPLLTAIGLPAVTANLTSTVALFPGYFGAVCAQRADLAGQRERLWMFLPAAAIGGLIGAILLLWSGEKIFMQLVPYLILFATLLLALGEPLQKWLVKQDIKTRQLPTNNRLMTVPVCLAAAYGGYFGAGMSVILLGLFAVILEDSLTRLNALKQAVALAANTAAVFIFLFSGKVVWSIAAVMAVSALLGGILGGKFASSLHPALLRWIIVLIGLTISIIYFIQANP